MASRFLLSSLGWLCFCCGGRAAVNAAAGGMGGSAIMVGTSGSVGTGGSVAPGGMGGSSIMVGTGGSVGGSVAAGGAASSAGTSSSAGTGGIDWAACAPPDTCVLETETACGAGCEPVPLSRFILVNSKLDAAYKKQQVVPPCPFGSCGPVPPNMVNASNYYAECEAGRCVGLDVRTSPLSACSTDAECILRSGTSCCGCGAGDLIAVSSKANVEVAFCGTNGGCAADCVSAPVPPGVAPYCSLGHCLVKYPDLVSDGGAAP